MLYYLLAYPGMRFVLPVKGLVEGCFISNVTNGAMEFLGQHVGSKNARDDVSRALSWMRWQVIDQKPVIVL